MPFKLANLQDAAMRRYGYVAVAVVIVVANLLALQSRSAHLVLGWASVIWPYAALVLTILIGVIASLRRHLAPAAPRLTIGDPAVQFCFIVGCAVAFQLPVFAAHVGIQPETGLSTHLTAVEGMLPFADAKQWYAATIKMAFHGVIGPYASRRPLNASMASTLFLLSGLNLKLYLHLAAALCGLAVAFFSLQFRRIAGTAAAVVSVVVLYVLIYDSLPTFMTETLGFLLGTLSAGFLLAAYRFRNPWLLALSTGLLLFAFSARAGAYLVIPALLLLQLYAAIVCLKGARVRLKYAVFSIGLLVIAQLAPLAVLNLYETRGGMYQGNLYYLLYDLATSKDGAWRGGGWKQFEIDFPKDSALHWGHERYEFIRQKTIETIRAHIVHFQANYLRRAVEVSFSLMPEALASSLFLPATYNSDNTTRIDIFLEKYGYDLFDVYILICIAIILGTRVFSPIGRIGMVLILLGLIFSLPVIWISPNLRFQSATFWIFAVLLAAPFALFSVAERTESRTTAAETESILGTGVAAPYMRFGLLIVAAVLISVVAPRVYNSVFNFSVPKAAWKKAREEGYAYILFGPHTPFLRYRSKGEHLLRPDVHPSRLKESNPYREDPEFLGNLAPGHQIAIGFVLPGGNDQYFAGQNWCIPDRETVFKAKIRAIKPPHIYEIESIEPAAFSPFGGPAPKHVSCR